MKITILEEAGYEWALLGLSKSFKDRSIPHDEWWTKERFKKLQKTSAGMAHNDGGHNKFLESIVVWIDIEAPRGWWQEFDTYRVGMTKQSDSTMHTLHRRKTTINDYEKGTYQEIIDIFNLILVLETDNFTKKNRLKGDSLQKVKWNLPEGYLQSRVVCTNYKTIRNMIVQRYNHNLEQWPIFIQDLYNLLEHKELLPDLNIDKNKK
jgi:hypothetical protein